MNIDSFVITISRGYPIKRCLEAIDNAKIPRRKLFLYLYLDTKDQSLIDYVQRWQHKQESSWFATEMKITWKSPLYPDKDPRSYMARWERIIENMKAIRTHLTFSEILFMVEDDTIIPPDAFKKLYKQINSDKSIGCIEGVEALRDVSGGCCGAWKMIVANDRIITKIGLKANKTGITNIDAGGYYCWAVRMEALKQIKFRASVNGYAGPDIWTWYDIKRNGWKTLIDWSIWCNHIGSDKIVYTPKDTRNWIFDFSKSDISPRIKYDIRSNFTKQIISKPAKEIKIQYR